MARARPILIAVGVLMTLMGLLWIGQGLGYVQWPESSFMLDQRPWADRGAALAVSGLLVILVARRLRRR
jgi:membrane protein implicated in regulation of membrane protease activity